MLERINEHIEVIKATHHPLSADVFIIDGKYIYDVGSNELVKEYVNTIEDRHIIISHFHQDHMHNLQYLNYNHLYGSKETIKHIKNIHKHTIVQDKILLGDIELGIIPASHCKGCVYLKYDNYLFLGDALYPGKNGYNVQFLQMQIKLIEEMNIDYCIISHKEKLIYKKEVTLLFLKQLLSRKEKGNNYIECIDVF